MSESVPGYDGAVPEVRRDRPRPLVIFCVCGHTPSLRAFPREIEEKRAWLPDEPVHTIPCQWCKRIVTVTAKAYHDAA